MTNECLVTKLKATVNNDSLEKLGVLTLKSMYFSDFIVFYDTAESRAASVVTAKNGMLTVSIVNNGGLLNGYSINVKDSNNNPVLTDLDISNKYLITKIMYAYNTNIEKFKTLPIMDEFYGYPKSGSKFSDFNISTLKRLSLTCNMHMFSDISPEDTSGLSFLRNMNLEVFKVIPGDTGSPIAPLSGIFEMSTLGTYLPDTINYMSYNTFGAEGSLEDFVVAARAHRTTGTIALSFPGAGLITFNGNGVSNTSGDLSWTANTITYRGETINV